MANTADQSLSRLASRICPQMHEVNLPPQPVILLALDRSMARSTRKLLRAKCGIRTIMSSNVMECAANRFNSAANYYGSARD